MTNKEIVLRAFEIMLEHHGYGLDFCNDIDTCEECSFYRWDICPNFLKENEFGNEEE